LKKGEGPPHLLHNELDFFLVSGGSLLCLAPLHPESRGERVLIVMKCEVLEWHRPNPGGHITRLRSLVCLPSGATDVFSTKLLKGVLPRAKLLIRSKVPDRRPASLVGGGSLSYPSLNPIELAVGPCMGLLRGRDMRSRLRDHSLIKSTESADVLKGIDGHGIAKSVLEAGEAISAPLIAHGQGEIGGEPELYIFRMIGNEDKVNFVKVVADSRHIQSLGDADSTDTF